MKIKFFGTEHIYTDYLERIERFFQNWEENIKNPDINTVLELYNIKQYFDVDISHKDWSAEQIAEYKSRCQIIPGIIGKYFNTINDNNLAEQYDMVDKVYLNDFWKYIASNKKVYEGILPDTIGDLLKSSLDASLDSDQSVVWEILANKNLSRHFGQVIADHLNHNPSIARKMICHFLAIRQYGNDPIYFPEEFTQEMRNKVLEKFVDNDDNDNIDYLRLLEEAQSTKEFPISDELRLSARKKKEKLEKESYLESSAKYKEIVRVQIKPIPDKLVKISEDVLDDSNIIAYTYNQEWIEKHRDFSTILDNFIYLFGYVDAFFRCQFVRLRYDLYDLPGLLRCVYVYGSLMGKTEYKIDSIITPESQLSKSQLSVYYKELLRLNIRLEEVFKWFFEDYLRNEFKANGFTYSPPSPGTTYLEKCKVLASAIDGILKQYRMFCEKGYIDRELFEISSGHIIFSDLGSMVPNKYVYSNSNEVEAEMDLLFSDQSRLNYSGKKQIFCETFCQLLYEANMRMEDFEIFQQKDLALLIKRKAVFVDEDGFLRINQDRVEVLFDLFRNEVICSAYNETQHEKIIVELVAAGELRYESTLFSRPEQDYLNYVLNKSVFSNGLDLRNKYIHDTASLDENVQYEDYMEFLKIMVLVILKIKEEFLLKNRQKSQE